jgi:hypothetical protein
MALARIFCRGIFQNFIFCQQAKGWSNLWGYLPTDRWY